MCRMKKTVATPVAMNVSVATKDRDESRANPHTPCPEVQPEPKVTPIPTRMPPMIIIGVEIGTWIAGIAPLNIQNTNGPVIIPKRIATRHVQSALDVGCMTPAIIPVAPKIRP